MRYHVSCAWAAGHKVGLQMTLAKPRTATVVKFREDGGIMAPGIWCRAHALDGRTIYEPFEVDADAGETALGVYAAAYKGVRGGFALLRKAQRLDLSHARVKEEPDVVGRKCGRCGVDASPRWHGSLCHLCWVGAGRPLKRKAEEMDADVKPLVNGRAVLA